MNLKEILARAYFYTKLGWGNYIAWWLGAIAYITVIYELVLKFILPANPLTYFLIFLLLIIFSFTLGLFMTRKQIYSIEHKINTETNPYINVPIGDKEILNFEATIKQLEIQIEFAKLNIKIAKTLGIEEAEQLEQKIEILENLKERYEELLSRAYKVIK